MQKDTCTYPVQVSLIQLCFQRIKPVVKIHIFIAMSLKLSNVFNGFDTITLFASHAGISPAGSA